MATKFVLVGSGLAGGLLAAYLGRRGHEVELYERRADPRAGNFVGGRSINLALSTRGIHAAGHGNGVLKDFLRDAELLERMNPAGRERKIDRAAAHEIPRARIGAALVKLDLVAAPAQIRREQSAREPTAY